MKSSRVYLFLSILIISKVQINAMGKALVPADHAVTTQEYGVLSPHDIAPTPSLLDPELAESITSPQSRKLSLAQTIEHLGSSIRPKKLEARAMESSIAALTSTIVNPDIRKANTQAATRRTSILKTLASQSAEKNSSSESQGSDPMVTSMTTPIETEEPLPDIQQSIRRKSILTKITTPLHSTPALDEPTTPTQFHPTGAFSSKTPSRADSLTKHAKSQNESQDSASLLDLMTPQHLKPDTKELTIDPMHTSSLPDTPMELEHRKLPQARPSFWRACLATSAISSVTTVVLSRGAEEFINYFKQRQALARLPILPAEIMEKLTPDAINLLTTQASGALPKRFYVPGMETVAAGILGSAASYATTGGIIIAGLLVFRKIRNWIESPYKREVADLRKTIDDKDKALRSGEITFINKDLVGIKATIKELKQALNEHQMQTADSLAIIEDNLQKLETEENNDDARLSKGLADVYQAIRDTQEHINQVVIPAVNDATETQHDNDVLIIEALQELKKQIQGLEVKAGIKPHDSSKVNDVTNAIAHQTVAHVTTETVLPADHHALDATPSNNVKPLIQQKERSSGCCSWSGHPTVKQTAHAIPAHTRYTSPARVMRAGSPARKVAAQSAAKERTDFTPRETPAPLQGEGDSPIK